MHKSRDVVIDQSFNLLMIAMISKNPRMATTPFSFGNLLSASKNSCHGPMRKVYAKIVLDSKKIIGVHFGSSGNMTLSSAAIHTGSNKKAVADNRAVGMTATITREGLNPG